jgi:hypothetical protein
LSTSSSTSSFQSWQLPELIWKNGNRFSEEIMLEQTDHDPEKPEPIFPRGKRRRHLPEIMPKQKDKIMVRLRLIGS